MSGAEVPRPRAARRRTALFLGRFVGDRRRFQLRIGESSESGFKFFGGDPVVEEVDDAVETRVAELDVIAVAGMRRVGEKLVGVGGAEKKSRRSAFCKKGRS